MKVIVNVGLPGSGKSSIARGVVKDSPRTVIVSRDNIRIGIAGSYQQYNHDTPGMEAYVKQCAKAMIKLAFERGMNVILDECNFKKKRRAEWIRYFNLLAEEMDVKLKIMCMYVNTPVDVCKARREKDTKDTNAGWAAIIDGMVESFEEPSYSEGFDEIVHLLKVDSDANNANS